MAFPELDESRGLRAAGQSGITIVISPLLALMKDQVDALKRRGISAECIDSTKSWDELQAINQQLGRGELRMIYCAPERLNNERFVQHMKHVPGGVRLVAVDEAHCISEVIANHHAVGTHDFADMMPVGPFLPPRVSQRLEPCYCCFSSSPDDHTEVVRFNTPVSLVARFVQEIEAERVICLTATATVKVVEDICAAFEIDEQGVFRTSPYRPK